MDERGGPSRIQKQAAGKPVDGFGRERGGVQGRRTRLWAFAVGIARLLLKEDA